MIPSVWLTNDAFAARPGQVNCDVATKSCLGHLPRRRLTSICLTLPAIIALALAVLILAAALTHPAQAAPGSGSTTGSMAAGRASHTATLLPNGQVLVAGGYYNDGTAQALRSAELYDPKAGTWSATNSMYFDRLSHTATLLPSGKVLVTGGSYPYLSDNTCELYDPATGAWSNANPMYGSRSSHTATLLPNGKVLVAGGVSICELYNPATGTWALTGPLPDARALHTATLLRNGKVLVAGGMIGAAAQASALIYDPASGAWTATASLSAARGSHTATLLPNGKVLVAGGYKVLLAEGYKEDYLASAEIYEPATGTWSPAAPMNNARRDHTANLLPNGKVLVAGGRDSTYFYDSYELYDCASGLWSNWPMNTRRASHTATLLYRGDVLSAGGWNAPDPHTFDNAVYLASAEIYKPQPPPQVQMATPLLAFFPFDGSANDVSGNNRHGTLIGPYLVEGWEGQAFFFNGTTDSITVPLDINPSIYPRLTIGCWARPDSYGSIQPLINHDDGGYDRQLGLDVRGGGIGWSAFCGPAGLVLGAVPAIKGKWAFVAAVYDQVAQTVKLQVDDMVLTKTGVTLGPGQDMLYIGCNWIYQTYFRGAIDNVFVFGDALTDEQLAYIRSGGAKAIMPWRKKIIPITIGRLLFND
jgi:hypothetical protein